MSNPPLPPPPPLVPPAGYAAYSPEDWRAQLRGVRGLSTALLIVLAVVAVAQIISLAATNSFIDAAEEFLETSRTPADVDRFEDDIAASGLVTGLSSLASIAVVVLSMIWLFRLAANHRTYGRQLTWAPGWAIGGWFLPPLLYIIPLLMLRETWKAANPAVPPGSPAWKDERGENVMVWAWFVLYSVAPILLGALGASQVWNLNRDAQDLADYFDDQRGVIIAQGVIAIVGAVAWALVVRSLTARHTELTGEGLTAEAGRR